MNLLLKIIGEPHNSDTLTLDSGPHFLFHWSKPHDAYVYQPKNQKEVDEIFEGARHFKVWTIVPVLVQSGESLNAAPAALRDEDRSDLEEQNATLTANLTAATKRIEQLKTEAAKHHQAMATMKAECEKVVADAMKTLNSTPATPEPAPAKKPHWKTVEKAAKLAAASPAAQPTATDDDLPAE